MSELPDEELPRLLDAAETELAKAEHRWFARATLLAALATGVMLLLPWTFSRRLGLSVWQLGVETQPALAWTWLAGLITSVIALSLEPGHKAQAAAGLTGVIAVVCLAGAWQARDAESLGDTWPGPGPTFAVITAACWLVTAGLQLAADRPRSTEPNPTAVSAAITQLRRDR